MYLFSDGPREYDFLLRILSLGRDWYWRKHVIDAAGIDENDTVLDIACGTGLLSYQFAGKGAQVVGVDVTREMLTRARALPSYKTAKVELIQARAEHLPFRSEVFEAATISLATRNVSNIENTFGEMQRCTKEGKKIISMDFTRPKSSTFRPFYYFYIFRVLPSLGLLISRHWNGIFLYLANSIKRSKTPEQLAEIMESIGMSDLSIKRMTQGTTALVSGTKRAIPTYSS
jgi:demethylmenaquinone methyltransferase/2-methoxy-6-polyprenyl-1,4-benzoquinol methylase